MENEENFVDNELLQNETEIGEGVTEVVAVDYTELLEQILAEERNEVTFDYTELLEQLLAEEQTQTEVLVGIRDEFADVDESIGGLEIMFGAVDGYALVLAGDCADCQAWGFTRQNGGGVHIEKLGQLQKQADGHIQSAAFVGFIFGFGQSRGRGYLRNRVVRNFTKSSDALGNLLHLIGHTGYLLASN